MNTRRFEIGDLLDLVPYEDRIDLTCQKGIERLSPNFLCCEENYIPIANNVPKDFAIVDFGCYLAAQSYLFQGQKYIGIDTFDNKANYKEGEEIPKRFERNGATQISSINDFIEKNLPELDLSKTYFVFSGNFIPEEERQLFKNDAINILNAVNHGALFMPGKEPITKGINANQIKNEYVKICDDYERSLFKVK